VTPALVLAASGPPVWAGIALIVVAALAGSRLARWRTRRRMRDMND
jgi:hypothetical protein